MDDADFYFDEQAAARAVNFFPDCLCHVKGEKAGAPFVLHESHAKIIRDLFGWKRRSDHTRRYRKAYVEIPRKNAKSTLAAGIALYLLLCDGEQGGEVYSAASTRDQASLVFGMAADMVKKSNVLGKHVMLRESTKRMLHKRSQSFYRAISADHMGAHGFNASGIIFDELHTQPDRNLWDVLDTSTGARKQPLTFAITTAGHDRSSICWELHQYAIAVRDGMIHDPSFYPVLFSADPNDDWREEATWRKANPLLGEAVSIDYLREQARRAAENPAFENTFRQLHLNQWTEQANRIVSMIHWDNCRQDVRPEDYHGRPCFAALDLSSTRDVTALALVFPEDNGGFTVFPWFWLPEATVDQRAGQDQRMIRNFASHGWVTLTSGNEVDVRELSEHIFEILQPFEVMRIGYDPWNSTGVIQLLKEIGISNELLVKMPQSFSTYNEPFKRLLTLLATGKFRHDGNAVLRWMAANVSHKTDASGNIRPDKGKSAEKIDGICAMLMAMALAIQHGETGAAYSSAGSGVILL